MPDSELIQSNWIFISQTSSAGETGAEGLELSLGKPPPSFSVLCFFVFFLMFSNVRINVTAFLSAVFHGEVRKRSSLRESGCPYPGELCQRLLCFCTCSCWDRDPHKAVAEWVLGCKHVNLLSLSSPLMKIVLFGSCSSLDIAFLIIFNLIAPQRCKSPRSISIHPVTARNRTEDLLLWHTNRNPWWEPCPRHSCFP